VRPQTDDYPEQIEAVVRAVIEEGRAAGQRALKEIAYPPQLVVKAPRPGERQRARIWIRDRFHCRYCRCKVIPNSLLELLSTIYPRSFPYHTNWKAGLVHPAFISRAATVDHIVPIAVGGAALDDDNLVTVCNVCNAIKSDFSLEQLHWELRSVPRDDWDGLRRYYSRLWEAARRPRPHYHLRWMRNLEIEVDP
jgi:5-methylcytosine-specific restriction endonuclease McrA